MNREVFFIFLVLIHLYRHFLGPHLLFWLLHKKLRQRIGIVKIQKKEPHDDQISFEKKWMFKSQFVDVFVIIFCLLLFKANVIKFSQEVSLINLIFKLVILFLLQDIYFYITHRLMHTKYLFAKIHSIHHRSIQTNPFTSFSTHPLEKLIELLFFPLIMLFVTLDPYSLLIFLFASSTINFFGHCGFELKALFLKRHDPIASTSLFHELHHMYPQTNFSLYFIYLDILFKTTKADYPERYRKLVTHLDSV